MLLYRCLSPAYHPRPYSSFYFVSTTMPVVAVVVNAVAAAVFGFCCLVGCAEVMPVVVGNGS